MSAQCSSAPTAGGPTEQRADLRLRFDGWSADPLQVNVSVIGSRPVSLMFGLNYARAKSLLLVVLPHGVAVLPNMSDFMRIWT